MNLPELNRYPYFSIDTEDTGLRYKVDKVFGISISTPDGQDFYWDIRKQPSIKEWLNEQVKYYRGTIIAHNASFDYRMLHHSGVNVPIDRIDDTVIRASCIDEHLFAYSLDYLVKKYLGKKKVEIYETLASMFGGLATKNVQMPNLQYAPPELVGVYAAAGEWEGQWVEGDSRLTLDLWEWQEKEIERQGIQDIIKFERDKMPTFIRTEMRGIRVDEEYAEEAIEKLNPIIKEKQDELDKRAGWKFNVNSSPQVKKYFTIDERNGEFFVHDTIIGKTPKGKPSLGSEYLRDIKDPVAGLILEVRSLLKTRDTFLRKHVLSHSVRGRVYPTINQSKSESGGTSTGRLSIQNPAMQQIPSRNKKIASIVKPCFLPDEGHVWVDSDMNSFEVRVFAHLVNNPVIIEAYKQNPYTDLHQFVADLTNLVRNATYSGQANAKQLNLSMIFNSGNGAIADKMGMPWEWESFLPRGKKDIPKNYVTYKKAGIEAMKVINKYHNRVQGVKQLAEKCKNLAEKTEFLFTFTGRRLRFSGGAHSYAASGKLIQATSADLNKENWIMIEDQLGDDGHIILNTHDSYSMSIEEGKWRDAYKRVKSEVEKPGRLRVPLILDFNGSGDNWWEALQGNCV